jgi:hypothetical protein
MNNTSVFVVSGRGGAGKSTAARNLYASLSKQHLPSRYVLIEIDGTVGGLNQSLAANAERIRINEAEIKAGCSCTLDKLYREGEKNQTVVIDCGANTARGITEWACDTGILNIFAEQGSQVWFAFVAPPADPDSLCIAKGICEFAGDSAKWLILCARHMGDNFAEWQSFAQSAKAIISDLPIVSRAQLELSHSAGEPFAYLAESPQHNVLQRARFLRIARAYDEAFSPIISALKY